MKKILSSFIAGMMVITSLGTNLPSVYAAFTDSASIRLDGGTVNLFIEQDGDNLRLANRVDNCS
jgi:hypothetical protein